MKLIKEFDSALELDAVRAQLKNKGIECEMDGTALYVHVGDIIKVRDIILDTIKAVREG